MAKHRGSRVFTSKAQWRWAFATHKPWARKHAHRTEALKGGPKVAFRSLPRRTGVKRRFR